MIGQCFCKSNVQGLTCNQCRPGFSNLSTLNPDGCGSCSCNPAGTFNGQDTCDSSDGQCLCKGFVMGTRCDMCQPNTTMLSASNPTGCTPCLCDPLGSSSSECHPLTGQCTCRPGVTGLKCDQCLPGFTGLSSNGCGQCSCDPSGSYNNTCDPVSGQCPCRPNVVGVACDTCGTGFYNISAGCQSCDCFAPGTVAGSTNTCNVTSGQCMCKPNVEGVRCDVCRSGFMNLMTSNADGCSACDCLSVNTDLTGRICDPTSSQCECVPLATGSRCDECVAGAYLTGTGCVSCDCDASGAVSSVCNQTTGDCTCQSNVTGRNCNTCSTGFYDFPR